MEIFELSLEMAEEAMRLLEENYEEAKRMHGILPEDVCIPSDPRLFQNGLGAAAFENGKMVGFLSGYGPWGPVFCTKDTKGVYSPLHAHAAVMENRKRIYQRLYQAAAEKWVRAGAGCHTISLYDPDDAAREAFFEYGFGKRCADLICATEDKGIFPENAECFILPKECGREIRPLRAALAAHLEKSPCFMKSDAREKEAWILKREKEPPRTFIARVNGRIAAYMEVTDDGENFITGHPAMKNICGAYCLEEFRGKNVAASLLGFVLKTLKSEKVPLLGVDCESINPTAIHFWKKHFSPYTQSLVRRIDEKAIPS